MSLSEIIENFFLILLAIVVVVAVVLLGYVIFHDFNLTGTAIGHYSATYCDPNGCSEDQKVHSNYLYSGDSLTCPNEASIYQYTTLIGKILISHYETYYIQEGTCQVQQLSPAR